MAVLLYGCLATMLSQSINGPIFVEQGWDTFFLGKFANSLIFLCVIHALKKMFIVDNILVV